MELVAQRMTEIAEAKQFLRDNFEKGARCPCCDQFVRLYKRKLNSSMARALVWMVGESIKSPDRWVDIPATAPKWITRTNQHPTLRWWGLIERMPNTDSSKKHSGIWRPTTMGVRFATGKIKVPEYVLHYNNKAISHSSELTTVKEAFGVKFNYDDMMRDVNLKGMRYDTSEEI